MRNATANENDVCRRFEISIQRFYFVDIVTYVQQMVVSNFFMFFFFECLDIFGGMNVVPFLSKYSSN